MPRNALLNENAEQQHVVLMSEMSSFRIRLRLVE